MEEKTPLMMQYASIKKEYPEALVLFQVGDFYEFFGDDAQCASSLLGITLTTRGKTKENEPILLCGIPVHTLEVHLKKLTDSGLMVVICDQLEIAKPGILVKRGVTRIFTPGTLSDNNLLSQKKPSYLMSIAVDNVNIGIVIFELLVGILHYTTIKKNSLQALEVELARFCPDEIIVQKEGADVISFLREYLDRQNRITRVKLEKDHRVVAKNWYQSYGLASQHYSSIALEEALCLIYYYAHYTKNESALNLHKVIPYQAQEYLIIDHVTKKNLELFENENSKKNSLFDILDQCTTPMGSRLLKKYMLFPLSEKKSIEQRLRIVDYFFKAYTVMIKLRNLLHVVGDLERIVGRISLNKAPLSDYRALKRILFSLPLFLELVQYIALKEECISKNRLEEYKNLHDLALFLERALNDDATKPYIINTGYNKTLDEIRLYAQTTKEQILLFEQQEQQTTGINSLKIRHHVSYGYLIEITKNHLDKIPSHYKRLQTLVGKERYVNDELQKLNTSIEHASKQTVLLEDELFVEIKTKVISYISSLRHLSFSYALFDVLATFAYNAHQYCYVLPMLNEENIINITHARHPVIEQSLKNSFVANDILLDNQQSFIILTGPNMGGKSTYLRQTGLICLMAHIGSFVPAKSANIMILDRIFTRVGGHDNVSQGKSTFFVEMEETAMICTEATQRSLVLLDEVGRGTSINEGIALAQAIVEYLYTYVGSHTLFATHYHELGHLTNFYPAMKSFFMETKTEGQHTLFLHTLAPGVCFSSFALEVAKLARLPEPIITRARELILHKK